MINICVTIFLIIITAIMVYKIYKEYKRNETIDIKVIFWLFLFIIFIPILVYYIDKCDVLSNYGWFENSSSDRWFSFFETYFSSLISAAIAAVVLIVMTIHQLNLDREKNLFDKRIQNAPIFKYEISNLKVPVDLECMIFNKIEGNLYSLFLNIENLGLNHARDIEFEIYDDIIEKAQKFKFDTQSFLRKDYNKSVRFIFNYDYDNEIQKNNVKKIKIIVSYQDLLNNSYEQEINVCVEVTNKFGSQHGGYELYIVSTKIDNEIYKEKK